MSNACRADDVGADADMSVEDFLDDSCAAHASLPYDPVDMLDHMIKQGGIPAIGELARRRRTLVRARTSLLLQINAQGRFLLERAWRCRESHHRRKRMRKLVFGLRCGLDHAISPLQTRYCRR